MGKPVVDFLKDLGKTTLGCVAIGAGIGSIGGPMGILVCGAIGLIESGIICITGGLIMITIAVLHNKIKYNISMYETLFRDFEKERLEQLEKERIEKVKKLMEEYEKNLKEKNIQCIGLYNIVKNNSYIKITYDELQYIINKIVKYEKKKDINELMKEKYFEQSLTLLQPISNEKYIKDLKLQLYKIETEQDLSKLDLYSIFLEVLIRGNYTKISKYDFKLTTEQNIIFQQIIKAADLIYLLFNGYCYLINNKKYINFKSSINDKNYINLSVYRIINLLIHNKILQIYNLFITKDPNIDTKLNTFKEEVIYILNCLSNLSFSFFNKTYEKSYEKNELDIDNIEYLIEEFCINTQYLFHKHNLM